MTHEELITEINIQLRHLDSYFDERDKTICGMKALRAVVELHKPLVGTSTCFQFCEVDEAAEIHKCPTIQAIEKELK